MARKEMLIKSAYVLGTFVIAFVIFAIVWFVYNTQGEENVVTYEECGDMGGAINNLTNDCWVNGKFFKTPYSRDFSENSDIEQ